MGPMGDEEITGDKRELVSNTAPDPGAGVQLPVDFKARLYQHYLSQHVRLSKESVQSALARRAPYLRKMIATCMPPDRSVQVLDLGCGYGGILWALRSAGYNNLTGVDISAEQVELAGSLGFTGVRCQDIGAFLAEIPVCHFHVAIAFDILEHFTRPDLFLLLDEVHRVLAPGGRLILHVPNGEALFSGAILHGDLTHEQAFTRDSLRQLAGTTGFRVVKILEDVPVSHGLRSLARNLIWRIGSLWPRLLAVAETGEGFRERPLSQNILALLEKN
jgi:SAM-dependent methyltransferase